MTPAEILRAAADLIEKNGKAIGVFRTKDGARCASAAICDSVKPHNYGLCNTARAALSETQYLPVEAGVVRWSDAHTAAEVVAGLRDAAKWSEEKGTNQ